MRKLLLFAWLPLVVFLFPLPPQAAKQLATEIHEMGAGEQPSVAGTPKTATQQGSSQAEIDALTSTLWMRWFQNLGLMVLGIIVGILAWRNHKHWKAFALGMSVLYLAIVVMSYVRVERPVPDALLFFGTETNFVKIVQLNLRLVEAGISNGSLIRPAWIIYNEILMPIFQIAVLAWLLWSYSRRAPQPQ